MYFFMLLFQRVLRFAPFKNYALPKLQFFTVNSLLFANKQAGQVIIPENAIGLQLNDSPVRLLY